VALEMGDEVGHRLLRHPRPVGEDAHARACVVEELEHGAVGRADLRVPVGGQPHHELVGHRAERLPQQDREVLGRLSCGRAGKPA
jgi:hypothetical protein